MYKSKIHYTNKAVKDLFEDIQVVDEAGKAHKVPLIWANNEKVMTIITDMKNFKPPVMSILDTDIRLQDGQPVIAYELNCYTTYEEEMNQIIEQIILMFDNKGNCKLTHTARTESVLNRWLFHLEVEGIGVPVRTKGE